LPLAGWRSLDWPLVGDATIFHFIAGQVQMGAVPYRDIFDINMPLIYYIHAAVVAIGGMSDVAWRAFDLTAALLMSGLILMLVWPAGRAVAILAVLIVLVTHFLLGPSSAGQRDFLMSIPVLAAALASAKAAEHRTRMSVADDADLVQVMTKRLSVLRRMPHGTKSHELPMPTHYRWPPEMT
jgi:hypothetical protein